MFKDEMHLLMHARARRHTFFCKARMHTEEGLLEDMHANAHALKHTQTH
jgi:hypothetical protein